MLRQKPYGNRIIVEVLNKQSIKSEGGAILSQADTAMGVTARILAVGPNVTHHLCVVGNEVIYPFSANAVEVYLDGKKYFTLLEQGAWFFQKPVDVKELAVDKSL